MTDSWLQAKTTIQEQITEKATLIFCLSDDCLLHIFSFLEFFELLKVSDVCARFREVGQLRFRRYKHLDCRDFKDNEPVTLTETRQILINMGFHLRALAISSDKFTRPEHIIEWIPIYCQNLTSLSLLGGFNLTDQLLEKYVGIFANLESLEVTNCTLDGTFELHLSLAVNLEKLSITYQERRPFISYDGDIRGWSIEKMTNLKYLDVNGGLRWEPETLANICSYNKDLKYLDISQMHKCTTANIKSMVESLTNLDHLVISSHYQHVKNLEDLGELSSLKKLKIRSNQWNNQNSTKQLLQKLQKKNQLEHLELAAFDLDRDSLEKILSFEKLRVLILVKNELVDGKFIQRLAEKGVTITFC